ncbi:hypothetical protein, partial [Salmonella enterica]|uniref:hypothetical protein n=1 Tax=Salmonella enterica TaxID=28901 RepID=UPI00344F0DF2
RNHNSNPVVQAALSSHSLTTDSSDGAVCDEKGQASRAGFINKTRSGWCPVPEKEKGHRSDLMKLVMWILPS